MKPTQSELEKVRAGLATDFGGRLVTLCDGRSGLRGGIPVRVAASEDRPVITFTASDETLDRYDEVISAGGWKLENYRKNPVFQNSHKYGDVVHTIGKAVSVQVKDNALVQEIEFAVDINPVANLAFQLYRGGFLNAVSVGFIPVRWEDGNAKSGYSRKYLEQELLELSAVSIPANPNALQNAVKSGAVDKSDLTELAEFLREFCETNGRDARATTLCSDQPETESHGSAPGSAFNGAQLLQLLKLSKQLLRLK